MKLYLTIGSKFKTQDEFQEKVKMFYPDDIVVCVEGKTNKDDLRFLHLDFAEFSYDLSNGNIEVRVKALGETWDTLNAEEGILPEEITYDLLSKGIVDNYVILAELKDEYTSEFKADDYTNDGLYKDFKLLKIGYLNENGKEVLIKIDENATNAEAI